MARILVFSCFLLLWFWCRGYRRPESQVRTVRQAWCAGCHGLDEHAQAELVFRRRDQEALRSWPFGRHLEGYVPIPDDHACRQTWCREPVHLVDPHTYAKLASDAPAWVTSGVTVEGSKLCVYRYCSASGGGQQGETLLLCHLAADPNLTILSWVIKAGGNSPYRAVSEGLGSDSLLEYLLR